MVCTQFVINTSEWWCCEGQASEFNIFCGAYCSLVNTSLVAIMKHKSCRRWVEFFNSIQILNSKKTLSCRTISISNLPRFMNTFHQHTHTIMAMPTEICRNRRATRALTWPAETLRYFKKRRILKILRIRILEACEWDPGVMKKVYLFLCVFGICTIKWSMTVEWLTVMLLSQGCNAEWVSLWY